MELLINEDLRVTEDTLNFILLRRTEPDPSHHFSKEGSTGNWKLVGYYSKIEHFVNVLKKQPISEQDHLLLQQLIEHVHHIRQDLLSRLNALLETPYSAIKIGKNYQFTKDRLNFTVSKRKESDPTHHFSNGIVKESWKVCGYFGKIEHVVFSVVERSLKEIHATTLAEFVLAVSVLSEQLTVQTTDALDEVEEDN